MSRTSDHPGKADTSTDYREAARQVGENLREAGGHVRDVATAQYAQMKRHAQEYYEQGRGRARDMKQSLEHRIQDKPIRSLLIAAGVGMLLGILWKRR